MYVLRQRLVVACPIGPGNDIDWDLSLLIIVMLHAIPTIKTIMCYVSQLFQGLLISFVVCKQVPHM